MFDATADPNRNGCVQRIEFRDRDMRVNGGFDEENNDTTGGVRIPASRR